MNLSSNWKALQKQLKADDATPASALKRKRSASADTRSAVTRVPHGRLPHKRRAMGTWTSKPSAAISGTSGPKASPVTATDPTAIDESTINQGLHPTHKPGKYLALDCEMVGTGPPPAETHVLARVSIVNYHGQQIYDTYVQPSMPVTDYRTHVSGIRPEHLLPAVARPYRQVRETVIELLAGKVLVGHALKNDIDVLMLSSVLHKANIRDTSRHGAYRARARGKTPSLKKLAQEVLGLEIQGGEHDSVVDARTAMELFKKEKEAIERDARKKWGMPRGPTPVKAIKDAAAGTIGVEEPGSDVGAESVDESVVGMVDSEDEDEEDRIDEEGRSATRSQSTALQPKKKKKKKSKRR